jgi:hypothetical protein
MGIAGFWASAEAAEAEEAAVEEAGGTGIGWVDVE